jgi:hypothetical protein
MAKDAGKVDIGAVWNGPNDDGDHPDGLHAGHFSVNIAKKRLPLATAAPGLE